MKKINRIICTFLALVMILGLASCKKNKEEKDEYETIGGSNQTLEPSPTPNEVLNLISNIAPETLYQVVSNIYDIKENFDLETSSIRTLNKNVYNQYTFNKTIQVKGTKSENSEIDDSQLEIYTYYYYYGDSTYPNQIVISTKFEYQETFEKIEPLMYEIIAGVTNNSISDAMKNIELNKSKEVYNTNKISVTGEKVYIARNALDIYDIVSFVLNLEEKDSEYDSIVDSDEAYIISENTKSALFKTRLFSSESSTTLAKNNIAELHGCKIGNIDSVYELIIDSENSYVETTSYSETISNGFDVINFQLNVKDIIENDQENFVFSMSTSTKMQDTLEDVFKETEKLVDNLTGIKVELQDKMDETEISERIDSNTLLGFPATMNIKIETTENNKYKANIEISTLIIEPVASEN